ncbi:hypothetical protein NQ314_020982 [Rhamnusium bicolor]|uniref:THAP-type domain-containing protein n=1 Tax=Rhamnusium bicolor TaxID=1586634 RepID=A0AAV8WJG0_9CUCU|nr:hypothetical protein NQ314_020982 [Rhamnusium bicolor]
MNTTDLIYKNKCCVLGCNDRTSKRHRFPKDVALLKRWVDNIKQPRLRELLPEEIYSYYVCDRHFVQEYLVPGTRRGLRRDAVPTVYLSVLSEEHVELEGSKVQELDLKSRILPSTSKECTYVGDLVSSTSEFTETTVAENPYSCSSPFETQHICPFGLSERRTRGILQSVNVTREKNLTLKCRKFYKMGGEWGRRTAKIHYKMKNFQARLANAEKVANCSNFTNLLESVNETTYTFIMQQVRNQNLRPKARRYTLDEKILSLTLLKGSVKGYRLLSKNFCLLSQKTLTNLLTNISLRPGINDDIVNCLTNTVSKLKNPNDKLCAVAFDEISLSSLLSYNRKRDCIDGLEHFGNKRTPHIASYVNVFMIKGICRQWKQPFAFTFSSGPAKSPEIKDMIKKVITSCQSIGLNVVATICDQGSSNQAAINALLKETNENCLRDGIENKYFGFLFNGAEIIPIYDVPYLFKGMRNNLLNKNLHFMIDGAQKVAKWKHIEQFYMLDTMDETTLCTKLIG